MALPPFGSSQLSAKSFCIPVHAKVLAALQMECDMKIDIVARAMLPVLDHATCSTRLH